MKKVVDLKTAKLLVEKGIILKTEKCWKLYTSNDDTQEDFELENFEEGEIPAPDIAELLEELPLMVITRIITNDFEVISRTHTDSPKFVDKELVEALAQALIWVKERK